ncbi:MAG: vacuolar family H+-ATPase subunit H [Lachnospiraceae bacterium]|jgi:vacuolar-type H+-ATPase subunit H|nr:vacuolar family H+-ATPase subunit H [Lachnospiraceae bacterium]
MTSRIEQLMDEIEEFIGTCKYQPFSSNKIIVNKDQMESLLRELRLKTPEEIKRYQKIITNKEAILNDARTKAEALIKEATTQTSQLVNEHEIMQQAYAQANEVVTMASYQAQGILDSAMTEANNVRMAAMQYMDNILVHLDNIIISSSNAAMQNYETLIGSLNQYKDIIQSNLRELHPEDDYGEEPITTTQEESASDIELIAGGVS